MSVNMLGWGNHPFSAILHAGHRLEESHADPAPSKLIVVLGRQVSAI